MTPELTSKQRAGVLAVLSQPTLELAAAAAGLSRRTLCRWLKEPAFKAAVANTSRQLFEDGLRQLRALAPRATETIAELREHGTSEHVRLRAAAMIYDIVGRADHDDILRRIEALEQREDHE